MANPNPGPANFRHPRYDKLKINIVNTIVEWIEDVLNGDDPAAAQDLVGAVSDPFSSGTENRAV